MRLLATRGFGLKTCCVTCPNCKWNGFTFTKYVQWCMTLSVLDNVLSKQRRNDTLVSGILAKNGSCSKIFGSFLNRITFGGSYTSKSKIQ